MTQVTTNLEQAFKETEQLNARKKVVTTILSVYLPVSLDNAFKAKCKDEGEKPSTIVRQLITTYLCESAE